MCAEFQINKQPVEIREWLNRHGEAEHENTYRIPNRIRLYGRAPIVVGENMQIETMQFSLKPPATKYPTFNARMYSFDERTESIVAMSDKKTWKTPLAESRCLIPMTGFIEPIYTGQHAGEMVEFEDGVLDMIFAAGVYEVSTDPKTREVYKGFSIIMGEPDSVVRKTGQHRSPVFLKQSSFDEWLSSDLDSGEAMKILNSERQELHLKVKTDRKMAKGWEKRVQASIEKSQKELEFEELLKATRFK